MAAVEGAWKEERRANAHGGEASLFDLGALEEHMPRLPGLRWVVPEGGMFLWITLPGAGTTPCG